MNDKEFQEFLEMLKLLDAEQFEVLVHTMSIQAAGVAVDSQDSAWHHASESLSIAELWVSKRKGN